MSELSEYYENFNKAEILGDVGEIITSMALRDKGFQIVRHLYVPFGNKFTEIDIVALCSNVLYVIENKNYSAKVKGNIGNKYFDLYYENMRCYLYNPFLQNSHHCKVLQKYLFEKGFTNIYLRNIVIFNNKSDLTELKGRENCIFTLTEFLDNVKIPAENNIDLNLVHTLKELSDLSTERMLKHKQDMRFS